MIYLSAVLCSFSLIGDSYVSPLPAGEYDKHLQCIVTVDGLCQTEYVDEVLELCKDCDITAPELVEVSDVEVWFRQMGIKLFYEVYEHPVKAVSSIGACVVGCYLLKKVLWR
jgi:hypothetical protein